jgi:hypothetical protein
MNERVLIYGAGGYATTPEFFGSASSKNVARPH